MKKRSQSSGAPKLPDIPQKYLKLKEDLDIVKGNINLTNEIIDACDPKDSVRNNDILSELMSTLRNMEQKLFQMIASMDNEAMMNIALLINDDLHKTLSRYTKLENHKKPESFVPCESTQNTSLNPTHIYMTMEQKAQKKNDP